MPPARRPAVRVRDVAAPVSRCTVAAPEVAMEDILDRIGSTTGTGVPVLVMEGGHLAGIITVHDTTAWSGAAPWARLPVSARG
ncbi:hypothetical protein ACFXKS_39180 [Streptomyces scopuliridis]|uniref:hypothetical protein n=1 Tax=Streptomyces scopuliridis TaxID=452529 RepID=UPI0036747BA6